MTLSRAKVITKTKGRLRGYARVRALSSPARREELKARLRRARTATVKPKGRLPNPNQQIRGMVIKGFKLGDDVIDRQSKKAGYIFSWLIGKSASDPSWVRVVFKDGSMGDRSIRSLKKIVKPRGSLPNSSPSFFSGAATTSAKRVRSIRRPGQHRVRERDTGQTGEILEAKPGGFVKVQWDNRQRPTLIKRSEIRLYPGLRNPAINGSSAYSKAVSLGFPYIRGDGKIARDQVTWLSRFTKTADGKGPAVYVGWQDVQRKWIVEKERAIRNPGLMELSAGMQALDYLGGKLGAGKRRRNPSVCSTCGKAAGAPFRVYDERGKVINGCIDDFHTGYLVTPSESSRWHNRKEAKAHRASIKKHLATIGKRSRRNPSAREMSERFQGQATGKAEEYYFSNSAPRLDMSRGGKLVFLKLKGKTIRVPASIVAIDPKAEKLWLGTKLQTGMFKQRAKQGEKLDFGDVDEICYLTAKAHIGNGKTFEYHHKFGENGGRKPTLIIDYEGMPILKGGDYKIEARGIVN